MKRTRQRRRDLKWAALHLNEHQTIAAIARLSGHHRNTVSRAINKIRHAAER